MSKGLRLTEKWMQRGLWLVAFLFAGFLIGLGGKLVDNMWDVQPPPGVGDFIDPARAAAARSEMETARMRATQACELREQAEQKLEVARSNTSAAEDTFKNWLSTRHATARPEQDAELIARTRQLDQLRTVERAALGAVQAQDQVLLDVHQAQQQAQLRWNALEAPSRDAAARAERTHELKVFGLRLALTLPLLLVAGWLFARKRRSAYWPFVWGFIFFAVFAFFVELVPYLPSYGGYVRYVVGIIVTVLVGRYAIVALQQYLARQKEAERMPEAERRTTLRYDVAQTRLARNVCPGCERAVDLKDKTVDFCLHCGIGLFDRCTRCATRKNAFARFCFSCGAPGSALFPD
ncbi:MAG: serine endopeptidase [Gammaproteobacteria bacterium]